MFYPTKDEFLKKCRKGNLIPVAAEIMADLETPVSAFLKLNTTNVRMGTTMILYRAEEHRKLELERMIKLKSKELEGKLQALITKGASVASMGAADKDAYFKELAKG